MTEGLRVANVIDIVDRFAPPHLAMAGDAIGLQLGNRNQPVQKIRVALDASPDVLDAAVAANVDMLVTHHALIYHPLKQIDTGTAKGASIARALAAGLTVYTAHTNLDIATGGVNDVLATRLGLHEVEILDETYRDPLQKVVVFTPESHHQQVLDAMCEAGAGHIGGYSHCTFSSHGEGTFKPLPGAAPFIGSVGRMEHVPEVRLETIVPAAKLADVLAAMMNVHPYEEVAYDVYSLALPGQAYGIGRIGNLPDGLAGMALRDFAAHVKQALGLPGIRFSGDPDLHVTRVSVLGGSGSDWVNHSLTKGAQVLVTSDCDHHDVAEAWQNGLAIIDATHAALEHPVLDALRVVIADAVPEGVTVEVCPVQDDPFRWL